MASLNIEEIINKEVARRVANELELRKEEVSSAARESLEKIKEISNENKETENRIANQKCFVKSIFSCRFGEYIRLRGFIHERYFA